MKNKESIITIAVIVAVLVIWQLWPSQSSPPTQQEDTGPIGDVPASRSKEYVLELGESVTLDIAEAAGSITVFTGPPGKLIVVVTRRSFGVDKESAQQDLEAFEIEPQQNGSIISLSAGRSLKRGRQVDYKVTAPENTSIKVGNGFGNITVKGLRGNVTLNGRNLNVSITDVKGAIAIQSETGSIKLADTTGELRIQSGSSSVQIDRATGPSTSISTGANTTLKDSGAETTATFRIQNGDLTLTRFSTQMLSAAVPNGQVRITESTARQADLKTQDGTINLYRVNAGELHASTTTGGLTMDQIQGSLEITTQQGVVNLTEAAASALNIAAGSGNVLFYGALPAFGEHTIKTTSGNISIFVVKESAFRLDASTKGTITIEPPFVLNSADKSSGRWRGVINEGGMLLSLSSTSGNILISSEQLY